MSKNMTNAACCDNCGHVHVGRGPDEESAWMGMKNGGVSNLFDLMVYAAAKDRDEPVLCTGRDYASTDVSIHPASRSW